MASDGYTPIADYGAIGNLRTVALVSVDGSIDWCCFPDLGSPSVFAAILDRRRGGRFLVRATNSRETRQRYEIDTNVLRTRFTAATGRLTVTDFMPLRGALAGMSDDRMEGAIHRELRCEGEQVEVEVEWAPRFDYARAETRMRARGHGAVAEGGGHRLSIAGLPDGATVSEDEFGPVARARFTMRGGETLALATFWDSDVTELSTTAARQRLEETRRAWVNWVHSCDGGKPCAFVGPRFEQVVRSGLTLKLLTHRHTGAIAAAATTSLPEHIGGVRNWDYRFAWIRDAAFTAQALFAVGHRATARAFLDWIERVAQASGESELGLQPMYGLHGERDLREEVLEHLEGHRGSRPVRIGNAAATQMQLDVYGELLNVAYELVRFGGDVAPERWRFLAAVADQICVLWPEPDYGIWEVRDRARHFVFSKVMAWVGLDRAIRLARRFGLPGNVAAWQSSRTAVRQAVLSEGYDHEVGAFVQSIGSQELDAANLLIPMVDFLPFDDPRVQGTIDRTLEQLGDNGLIYRYRSPDGLPAGEGTFGLATFWMVDALCLSGRLPQAREMFEGVASRANHVGLFAEEFDAATGEMLGNFPQAFTHVGLINSSLHLAQAMGERPDVPPPLGSPEHRLEADGEEDAAA